MDETTALTPLQPAGENEFTARLARIEEALARMPSASSSIDDEVLAERVLQVLSEKAARQRAAGNAPPVPDGYSAPVRTIVAPYAPPVPGLAEPPAEQSIWFWLTHNVWGELRLMAKMYLDPRYRLSRVTQLGVPCFLGLFVLNYFLFNYTCIVPIAQQFAERLVCGLLAVGLYKLLSREVGRYRQVLNYLSQYG